MVNLSHPAGSTESDSAILEAVERAKIFGLCLRRIWAVASSLPGRQKSLPAFIPPVDNFSVPGHNRQHHEHEQCTFDLCEHSRVDFTSVAQRHEKSHKSCDEIEFPLKMLHNQINTRQSTAWKLSERTFLGSSYPYMAISHVWADGTGVGAWGPGKVNKCLYDLFCEIARHFQCEGCWWDTISIPSDDEYRSKALNNMHNNYADARITLVHDLYIRSWEWIDAEVACFAIVMSPWYSRGWTSLELAKSHKVKIMFKAKDDGYVIKDLDVDILAPLIDSSNAAAKSVRMLRNASIQSLSDLLAILSPRDTSKPRDVPIISGLLAGVDVSGALSQQEIYQRILRKLGKVAQGHLFHNAATMSAPGFSWCPTNLLDIPTAEKDSDLLELQENGDVEGVWRVYSVNSVQQGDFIWRGTHSLTQVALKSALSGQSKGHHLLLVEKGGSGFRALLVKLMRNEEETTKVLCCQFVGPVYFRPALDGNKEDIKYRNSRVRIGSTEGMKELRGKAWDLVLKMDEANTAPEMVSSLEDVARTSNDTTNSNPDAPLDEDGSVGTGTKNWEGLLYFMGDVPNLLLEKERELRLFKGSKRRDSYSNLPEQAELKSDKEPDIKPQTNSDLNATDGMALYFLLNDHDDGSKESHAKCRAFFYGNQDIVTYVKDWLKNCPALRSGTIMLMSLDKDDQVKTDCDAVKSIASLAGEALLHVVEHGGHCRVDSLITLLLDSGAKHRRNSSGWLPLHLAVEHGDGSMVEKLLRNETNPADADAVSFQVRHETAIHLAARKGDKYYRIVKLLVEKSKNLNIKDQNARTALHLAASKGQLQISQLLLKGGADTDVLDSNKQKALHYAAKGGHSGVVTALLEGAVVDDSHETLSNLQPNSAHKDENVGDMANGEARTNSDAKIDEKGDGYKAHLERGKKAKPDSPDFEGQTALHLAAQANHTSVIEVLIDYGAKVSPVNNNDETPMIVAAKKGHHKVVEILLGMNRQSFELGELNTAMLFAAKRNHFPVITLLHRYGARSGIQDPDGMTALHYIIQAKEEATAGLLIEGQTNVEAKDRRRRQSVLLLAADKGLKDAVVKLLKNGALVKSRDSDGRTALHRAAISRNVGIIKVLLDASDRSVVNEQDSQKRTALHWAAISGSAEAVGHILEAHANSFLSDRDGRSALILAAEKGHEEAVKRLLESSDLKARGEDGKTALDWAANRGSDEVVRALLHKIDMLTKSEADETKKRALEFASDKGHLSVAMLLRDSISDSALKVLASQKILFAACTSPEDPKILDEVIKPITNPNRTDKQGRSALMLAVDNRNLSLTTNLLSLQANINLQDLNGLTALMIASKSGRVTFVKQLLDANANPDMQDKQKYTALHHAIMAKSFGCLLELVDRGANTNIPDRFGRTPLHLIAQQKPQKMKGLYRFFRRGIYLEANAWIKLLLHGARPNMTDEQGRTPLHFVVLGNREDLIGPLFSASGFPGLDIDIKDHAGKSPLLLAAEQGYEQLVEILLRFGLKPDCPDNEMQTPLLLAAAKSNIRSVQELLAYGADPNVEDKTKRTPLLLAAQMGDHISTSSLLEKGANPNIQDELGRTALLLAAQNGHEKIVSLLTLRAKEKVKVDTRDDMGRTALLLAAENGHAAIVKKLVDFGADLNIEDNENKKAWRKAMDKGHAEVVASLPSEPLTISDRKAVNEALLLASRRGWTTMVKVLLQRGADITFQSEEGWTALHMAVMNGRQEVVKVLLNEGVSIIIRDKKGRTALMQATEHGFESIVGLILSREEVQTDVDGWMGQDALLFAAEKGFAGIVELLLKNIKNSDKADQKGRTAMMLAAANGNRIIVELLLNHNANSAIKDNQGRSALHHAAWGGYYDVVDVLLNKISEVNSLDSSGQSALHLAAERASKEVTQRLLEMSPNVNAKANDGQTALHRAAWGGSKEVVLLLLNKSADSSIRDASENKPWQVAAEKGQEAIVELLLKDEDSVNEERISTDRALIYVSKMGYATIAASLLRKGADPTVKDKEGLSPLHWAAERGDVALVQLLIQKTECLINAFGPKQQTALCRSVLNSRPGVVKLLLQNGADTNIPDETGRTVLHHAAKHGDWEILQILVDNKADPHIRDHKRKKAWQLAAKRGYHHIVRCLLGREVDLNPHNQYMKKLLLLMAQMGSVPMVQLLLEKGVDKDTKDRDGKAALALAAEYGRDEVLRLLLSHGADRTTTDLRRQTPLLWAAKAGNAKMISLILENLPRESADEGNGESQGEKDDEEGTNRITISLRAKIGYKARLINHRDSENRTPLLLATEERFDNAVKLLLDKGSPEIDVNMQDITGRTALQLAAEQGKQSLVQLLLSSEAEQFLQDSLGRTALFLATEQGHNFVVKTLLENSSVAVDIPDSQGQTALQVATERGNTDLIEALLIKGASIDHQDKSCRTALLLAAEDGNNEVVNLLLKHKADQRIGDLNKRTPLSLSTANGDKAVVRALLEHSKLDPSPKGSKYPTANHSPEQRPEQTGTKIVPTVDSNVKDSLDLALLDLAVQSGSKEVVWLVAQRMTSV